MVKAMQPADESTPLVQATGRTRNAILAFLAVGAALLVLGVGFASSPSPQSSLGYKGTTIPAWNRFKQAQLMTGLTDETNAVQPIDTYNKTALDKFWTMHYAGVCNRHGLSYLRVFGTREYGIKKSMHCEDDIVYNVPNTTLCLFTFVEDPQNRFVDGYTKFEYRMSKVPGTNWPVDLYGKDPTEYAVGTVKRAKLYVDMFITLKWIHKSDGFPQEANGRFYEELPYFGANLALDYLFPQSAYKPSLIYNERHLDFIGHLETFDEDWAKLQEKCGVNLAFVNEPNPKTKFIGNDPMGTSAAMKKMISNHKEVTKAICVLYLQDYKYLAYEPPEACKEIVNWNWMINTFKYKF